MKQKIYAIRINEEMVEKCIIERLRTLADSRQRPVSFLIRHALEQYLEREEGNRRRFPWFKGR